MLRNRIIFTLIYEDGKFNQSRNFRLQKVGDVNWLEKNYKFKEIAFSLDELMVLNASKKKKNIGDFAKVLERLVNDVFIPIAVGGGIRCMQDAELLFSSGADKLVLNGVLYTDKILVNDKAFVVVKASQINKTLSAFWHEEKMAKKIIIV